MLTPSVIYEDADILVIVKPAGWITNDADTTKNQETVQSWVARKHQSSLSQNRLLRNGIVHRLDKETSGILLIARNEKSFYELQRQFKERIVKKTYLALVHGKVEPDVGEVTAAVGRLPWRRDRFGVLPGGRDSITAYKAVKLFCAAGSNDFYTLVEFYPRTGRTHQIRIHAKYIGHPIVADDFYAGRKTSRKDRKWCPRLFLHAASIRFLHPETGKTMAFASDLTDDLKEAMQSLKPLNLS